MLVAMNPVVEKSSFSFFSRVGHITIIILGFWDYQVLYMTSSIPLAFENTKSEYKVYIKYNNPITLILHYPTLKTDLSN